MMIHDGEMLVGVAVKKSPIGSNPRLS